MSAPPPPGSPAAVVATRVTTDWGHLAALEARPGSYASAVLMVPGFTGSKEDFLAVLPALAGAGHRVVAVDQRGQHESPHSPEPSAHDLAALAGDVLAAAAGLGEARVHLLGHSFGGLVARAAVLRSPGAFASLTLLCSGPAAIPPPRAHDLPRLIAALPVLDLATIHAEMRSLERARSGVERPAEVEAFLRRRFLSSSPVSLRRMAEHLLGEPDRVDELAATGLPVHVAYGERDDVWPPAAQHGMARRLGARESVLPGAVHSPAVEAPAATAAALAAFWAGVDAPARADGGPAGR